MTQRNSVCAGSLGCVASLNLLFDIDNFKGYNDTYGHQAGDRCLQAVAKAIGDAISATSGLSARYGGEEFARRAAEYNGRRRPEGRRGPFG